MVFLVKAWIDCRDGSLFRQVMGTVEGWWAFATDGRVSCLFQICSKVLNYCSAWWKNQTVRFACSGLHYLTWLVEQMCVDLCRMSGPDMAVDRWTSGNVQPGAKCLSGICPDGSSLHCAAECVGVRWETALTFLLVETQVLQSALLRLHLNLAPSAKSDRLKHDLCPILDLIPNSLRDEACCGRNAAWDWEQGGF